MCFCCLLCRLVERRKLSLDSEISVWFWTCSSFTSTMVIFLSCSTVFYVMFFSTSGPAKTISFTEVKHGCVRSETGWATVQINDQKTAHSAVLRKGR